MNLKRLAMVGAVAMSIGSVFPSLANAKDYCVYPNPACGQGQALSFQSALDLAAGTPDADRVLLGADTYHPPGTNSFTYVGSSPVEIVGAGRGQTVLTGVYGAQDGVLQLVGGPGSSVHDLTVRIPSSAAPDFVGLLMHGTARRIEVTEDSPQGHRYGVVLDGGAVLEDSSVTLDRSGDTVGVSAGDGYVSQPSVLRGTAVEARVGAEIEGPGVVERSRVLAEQLGVVARDGDTAIRDSLLLLGGSAGTVLRAETWPGSDTNVTVDGATIYASPKLPDTGGVAVSTAPDTTRNVNVTLANSIVRGFTPLLAVGGGAGKATISASYSDYDPNAIQALGGSANITAANASNVGLVGFNTQDGHEHELVPGSPLIDAGDPASQQGIDLGGNPRVADGNGDGLARRDLGAFELQPAPGGGGQGGGVPGGGPAADTLAPVVSRFRADRSRLRVGHGTRFRYRLSESARVTVRIQRARRGGGYRTLGKLSRSAAQGANRLRFSGRIRHRALRPGRYRAVIRAADAAGNRSTPRKLGFRVVRG